MLDAQDYVDEPAFVRAVEGWLSQLPPKIADTRPAKKGQRMKPNPIYSEGIHIHSQLEKLVEAGSTTPGLAEARAEILGRVFGIRR